MSLIPAANNESADLSGEVMGDDEETKLDSDEDISKPQYIPKKGTFYEHDNRTSTKYDTFVDEKDDQTNRKQIKTSKDNDLWVHDLYDEKEQAPLSREEIVTLYGHDIRSEDRPPEEGPYSSRKIVRRTQANCRETTVVTNVKVEICQNVNIDSESDESYVSLGARIPTQTFTSSKSPERRPKEEHVKLPARSDTSQEEKPNVGGQEISLKECLGMSGVCTDSRMFKSPISRGRGLYLRERKSGIASDKPPAPAFGRSLLINAESQQQPPVLELKAPANNSPCLLDRENINPKRYSSQRYAQRTQTQRPSQFYDQSENMEICDKGVTDTEKIKVEVPIQEEMLNTPEINSTRYLSQRYAQQSHTQHSPREHFHNENLEKSEKRATDTEKTDVIEAPIQNEVLNTPEVNNTFSSVPINCEPYYNPQRGTPDNLTSAPGSMLQTHDHAPPLPRTLPYPTTLIPSPSESPQSLIPCAQPPVYTYVPQPQVTTQTALSYPPTGVQNSNPLQWGNPPQVSPYNIYDEVTEESIATIINKLAYLLQNENAFNWLSSNRVPCNPPATQMYSLPTSTPGNEFYPGLMPYQNDMYANPQHVQPTYNQGQFPQTTSFSHPREGRGRGRLLQEPSGNAQCSCPQHWCDVSMNNASSVNYPALQTENGSENFQFDFGNQF